MRITRRAVVAATFSFVAISALAYFLFVFSESECISPSQIKLSQGNYARKDVFDQLSVMKDWSAVNKHVTGYIDAVSLSSNGEAGGSLGWHEGGTVCAKFKDGALWAKLEDAPPNPPHLWEGPFVFVGKNVDVEDAYFYRIFGDRCYKSEAGEKWCFGPGFIALDGKSFAATLHPDSSEMPNYGTPVSVAGKPDFWIFVPDGNGWKVFEDSFVTEEGHVNIDPNKSTPWRTLKFLSTERANG